MGQWLMDIADGAFNPKMSQEYDLSMQCSDDQIQYMVVDHHNNVLLLKSFGLDPAPVQPAVSGIREVFLADPLLSLSYRQVRISVASDFYTLIPEPLFQKGHEMHYLHQVAHVETGWSILTHHLPTENTVLVAALDKTYQTALSNYFTGAAIFHPFSPLLAGCQRIAQHRTGMQLFANIRHHLLQMALFRDQHLIFTNQFPFHTTQDFVYFLMLVFDQFGLDPEETPLFLSGMLLEDSDIYRAIYRYVRHPGFVAPPAHLILSPPFRATQHHLYFDLYSLQLCESSADH